MAVKQQPAMMNGSIGNASDRDKVILRIDEEEGQGQSAQAENNWKSLTGIANDDEPSNSLERNNSYFFRDDVDPPTKLIETFLRRQKESGAYHLDPGVDHDLTFWESPSKSPNDNNLKPPQQGPSMSSSPPTRRPSLSESMRSRRRSSFNNDLNKPPESPMHRISSGFAKSRFVEQPPRSGLLKSGLLKSGLLNNNNQNAQDSNANAQQEEDPLDLPEDWKKGTHKSWDFWLFFEWMILLLSIGAVVCSLTIPILKHRKLLGLNLWRWCVLGLVILGGRLLSGWIIRFIVFFIERNFILRKRLVYFVYGLQKGVQKCLWFGIILLAWRLIFDPNLPLPIRRERKMLQIVTKILVCLLVAASLWLLKILLVKVLALNFHVNTYFDRIQESLFNQYILEALSGPPLLDHQSSRKTSGEIDNNSNKNNRSKSPPGQQQNQHRKSGNQKSGNLGENGITLENLQRMNQRNISAWNMKRLIRLAKSSRITTLTENLDSDSASATGDANKNGIESEWQARAAAKHVFHNVAWPGCKYITVGDLLRFLGDEDTAIKALALFDGGLESGKITKQSLVNWVVNVYRERRALSFSLNDTKTAVNKLHQIIDVIMVIIILIIWLLILGIATTHLLVALSSQLVLVVFVFGNTCKTVFEAIVFLFAMHPFDVGDRCIVDGVQMVVEEMNILSTVFLRYDNEKIYYPNSVLATKPISNWYRSPDMGDAIDFSIHISTSNEKIEALKVKIKKYIDTHSHHWYAKHDVVMKEIEDMNRIRMAIWLQHTMNHQNAGEKWIRRSQLLMYLKDALQELEIDYRLLPQEVHLRDMRGI